ncbi:MAG TPA: cysteine desulfurase CsdA [Lentisphaeria bacterium]|mgnify:CR=1 FL=1|nr:cysteine desulfurase CsdA [Lentisphaeria bacterium]
MNAPVPATAVWDTARIQQDFPILSREVHGKPLVYLDSAATTQRPVSVVEAVRKFDLTHNANVHRGVHLLSQEATQAYEGAREKVRRFLNAASVREILFVRGTTEAINLVSNSFGTSKIGAGDEIVVSSLEHHSNIVPWQMLAERTGAVLRVIPMSDSGDLDQEAYRELLNARTRLVALTHISNALGTVNPVREMIAAAHEHEIPVLVDGAQAVAHTAVDVRELDCDFYAFSGHKLYGPTGIGVLYGREALLEAMPPWQGGGDMIASVSFSGTTYNELPYKFEAGTPNISGAVGLGAAVDYVEALGLEAIAAHEADLLDYLVAQLSKIDCVRLIGEPAVRGGAVSFLIGDVHPHDIGTILDCEGIAIRAGHHCAQPIMERLGIPATARASVGVYNTKADIDSLVAPLPQIAEMFAR